jgi:hypothetical protein
MNRLPFIWLGEGPPPDLATAAAAQRRWWLKISLRQDRKFLPKWTDKQCREAVAEVVAGNHDGTSVTPERRELRCRLRALAEECQRRGIELPRGVLRRFAAANPGASGPGSGPA